jgi:hypothetical protein
VEAMSILLGFIGSGFLTLLVALATGQIVPSSKAETWKAAYEELKRSDDQKDEIIKRVILSAEISDKVAAAVKQLASEKK